MDPLQAQWSVCDSNFLASKEHNPPVMRGYVDDCTMTAAFVVNEKALLSNRDDAEGNEN